MQTVVLKITGWNSANSWTSDIAHTKSMLVDLVRQSTSLSHTEAKRLIKALFARHTSELVLIDGQFYSPIRNALQSVGAQVETQLVQPSSPFGGTDLG